MRRLALALGLGLVAAPAFAQVADLVDRTAFRVCADPANKPLSAEDGSGFENQIAEVVAAGLGVPVRYTWFPQVTGFIRQTLQAGKCDGVMGYAQGDELVLNTNHYYTSTHVARLGMMKDARPYDLMVDRRVENPAGDMLRDLEAGEIDAALLWGPIGGPLVKDNPALQATPLLKEAGPPRLVFRITMGVRAGEDVWKRELNSQIRRDQTQIDAILREAGVPILDDFGKGLKPAG